LPGLDRRVLWAIRENMLQRGQNLDIRGCDQTAGRLAGHYSATAPQYEHLWAPVLEPFNLRLLAQLPLRGARRVLDVGAGVGTLLPHIRARASKAQVVGIDRSMGMIALAPRDLQRAVADVSQLPTAAELFDVAILAFMLFHVPDPLGALVEVRRVLVPRGCIGITTWGRAQAFLPDDMWTDELDSHGAPPDATPSSRGMMDSPEKLADLLNGAGFRVESIQREPFEQTHSVDELVALKSSLGPTARRLARLDEQTRGDCLARMRQRLVALSRDALTDRDEVIFAIAAKKQA